ncbi:MULTISPECIES: bifunctional (p)ppGpp synthetase/guanosine-3',5'-bis(diphosphate) 3'-pyrophosphohydrolase [unclassified Gemella]|uniref:RelA/SpoT family protein n=1 Tax=unclassified Gemella TaxID=2624949 RepID=UPI00107387F0|nr:MULTISPECIES: bifunctional (p)ppGpp synthetase/guanosine-3',5'-bis(diphosphate) 3'-pyrophosphohydrolase [unclassified Gemella]MBF0709990.1 bifunctional (p)ppGpp synthetase/guanosine-3',5'-bis(diphosphate) 3'-pyrophosphohydrolase [Gemella sp. GL1.1]MBF0746261.1 bifunctional (p)ppGpp synthetase/guanosine-3',5'-bis(diphosphate) 3'-pyrophosphohydrolase [Gemella sp. 19428wG2_WT2a]NYS27334.1 bifunctional (p)ppGpp synthetase/guanosine-3',5'-bis(diphosphate) 3'-pyrophosphohydrolase [Gemella sp. GL1]
MNLEYPYSFEDVYNICKEYIPEKYWDSIEKSYQLAEKAHRGQMRKSGEDYILHPIQVAGILAELKLDYATVCAGFLHDVVEDTEYTLEDITDMFNEDISAIVDGVTKLDKVKFTSKKESQAENHRKLFIAIASDIRVIFVKLADRLHNMRTLKHMKEEKKKEISSETLEIYAPLAHRLGISSIKWELEDTSLRYLHPEQYFAIVGMMKQKRSVRLESIKEACDTILELLKDNGIVGEVSGRPKHIYSIYKKMQKSNKTFEEIYDLLAVRVLVDSVVDCYATLGLVNNMWIPIPGRMKDYIAMPKPNMYQSLHTTLLAPNGQPLEVQIRTYEMHEIAEKGIAAHWAYKEGRKAEKKDTFYQKLDWFQKIAEGDKTEASAEEFMDSLKVDLLSDKIYVFTPNSDIIELPKGSCVVDFAYAIHTEVGNKMVGAKINDKIVPFDYILKTGEICDVRTSNSSTGPSRDWLNIAKSSQTKSKIKSYFKKVAREENLEKGEILLKDEIKLQGFDISEIMTAENIDNVLQKYRFPSLEELYRTIGYGAITANQVFMKLTEKIRKEKQNQEKLDKLINAKEDSKKILTETGVYVKGVDNILVRLSKCCQPIPGDKIVGFITKGRGVTVHRAECPNVKNEDINRLLEVEWVGSISKRNYPVSLQLQGFDKELLLSNVLIKLNETKVVITKLNSVVKSDKTCTIDISMLVKNVEECDFIMKKLRQISDIYVVERIVK